jgi:hypothetical protein
MRLKILASLVKREIVAQLTGACGTTSRNQQAKHAMAHVACGPTEVIVLLTVFVNEEKCGREVAERVHLL